MSTFNNDESMAIQPTRDRKSIFQVKSQCLQDEYNYSIPEVEYDPVSHADV